MRIACFADLHAHLYKDFNTVSVQSGNSRLDQITNTLRVIRDFCVHSKIDHLLFAGDLFHKRKEVEVGVFNTVYDEIKLMAECGIQIIAIPGNHDQVDNSETPQHSLHTLADITNVSIYDDACLHNIIGTNTGIFCVPYRKNSRFILDAILQAEDYKNNNPSKDLILLAHLGVTGCKVNNTVLQDQYSVEDLKPHLFKYGVLGHYHNRQFLPGTNHFFYCGSPLQHSYSDEGEDTGIYVIDTDRRWNIEFVPIPSPKFVTVRGVNDLSKLQDSKDFIRFIVDEGELDELQANVPPNLQYKVEVEKRYEQTSRVDVKVGMSFEETIAKYAEEFNPQAKDIGLKILSEVNGTE